jgi:hypothetical protein
MRRKILVFLFLVILILIISIFYFYKQPAKKRDIDSLAKEILKTCSKSDYRPTCYDKEIPKTMDDPGVTMEEAFEITKKIQDQDKIYLFCHVLGHELADAETKKDVSKWLDVVSRCPALTCNNGCPHGAIMRKFKGEEILNAAQLDQIIPDLQMACEPRGLWNPTEVERGMCYHSMGHTAMYISGADINKSLEICKKVGSKDDGRDYYQTCTQGVFMIIFQGIDPDDIALVAKIKPTKEEVAHFCSRFTGPIENTACRTEAWPLYFEEITDPKGLEKFCSFTKNTYSHNWCYDTGLNSISLQILESKGVEGMADYCLQLSPNMQKHCFASTAAAWVQNEPRYQKDAIKLCQLAENSKLNDACYHNLLYYSVYSFDPGSTAWNNYCYNFPDLYKSKCLKGEVPSDFYNL